MTNIYVHEDLHEMNLYPCAYSMTFNVTKRKSSEQLTLNGILNQRSQDVLTANNWNVCQYAVLLHMFAQVCGMKAGELVHVIADAHIYDRHVPMIEELISREPLPAPKFWLNPEVKDFYDFTPDDVKLEDMRHIRRLRIGYHLLVSIPLKERGQMHVGNRKAGKVSDRNWGIGYQNRLAGMIPHSIGDISMMFFRQKTQEIFPKLWDERHWKVSQTWTSFT